MVEEASLRMRSRAFLPPGSNRNLAALGNLYVASKNKIDLTILGLGVCTSREFSVDGGELGPSLKLKRFFVAEKYKEDIDQMYQ